jgi:hypothetical protein
MIIYFDTVSLYNIKSNNNNIYIKRSCTEVNFWKRKKK